MSNEPELDKLSILKVFLEKEERNAKLIYESSITSLLETGKSTSRISSIRSRDKIMLINDIKDILK